MHTDPVILQFYSQAFLGGKRKKCVHKDWARLPRAALPHPKLQTAQAPVQNGETVTGSFNAMNIIIKVLGEAEDKRQIVRQYRRTRQTGNTHACFHSGEALERLKLNHESE